MQPQEFAHADSDPSEDNKNRKRHEQLMFHKSDPFGSLHHHPLSNARLLRLATRQG
jgi:hypothetical protein